MTGWEVNGNGSGSCSVGDHDISGVETSVSNNSIRVVLLDRSLETGVNTRGNSSRTCVICSKSTIQTSYQLLASGTRTLQVASSDFPYMDKAHCMKRIQSTNYQALSRFVVPIISQKLI
jgi:hypothetical protein